MHDFFIILALITVIPKFQHSLSFKTALALSVGKAGLNSNNIVQTHDFMEEH
jgi:hypothetical protein